MTRLSARQLIADLRTMKSMHELGITQEIVDIVSLRADGARVSRVVLRVGKLTAILPDAVRFCFDVCTEGTTVEGARLDIVEVPARARCTQCAAEHEFERPFGRCNCGCSIMDWLSGDELVIQEMELL